MCSFSWFWQKTAFCISTHEITKHHPRPLSGQNLKKVYLQYVYIFKTSTISLKYTTFLHIHAKTQSLCMNMEPHCWHSFTSRCKWLDLKFSLCVLCLATLMLYLCWGLFSLQRKNLCLNGSALKVAPTAFNGLQTRLDPWLPSVPILCIQMERNQPVWQSFCFDTEWVQSLAYGAFWNWEVRTEKKKENP